MADCAGTPEVPDQQPPCVLCGLLCDSADALYCSPWCEHVDTALAVALTDDAGVLVG